MFLPSSFILIANITTVILLLHITIITIIIIIGPGTVTAGNQCSSGSTLAVASCLASRCRKHLASKHNNLVILVHSLKTILLWYFICPIFKVVLTHDIAHWPGGDLDAKAELVRFLSMALDKGYEFKTVDTYLTD